MATYESAQIATLLPPPRLDNAAQEARVDRSSGGEHLLGALAQDGRVAIQAREVQAHKEGACLDIVDSVGEEVGDGLGDLVGGDIDGVVGGLRPQAPQKVFDVDDGRRLGWASGGLDKVRLRAGA